MNESETLTDLEDNPADRRVSTRVPFGAVLGICECDGDKIPSSRAFRTVKGFNLSHTGISFTTLEWPQSDRLIVMLGDPERPNLVRTHIVRCVRKKRPSDTPPFEVNCEFDEWLVRPAE